MKSFIHIVTTLWWYCCCCLYVPNMSVSVHLKTKLRACACASGYSKNAQKNEHKNFSSACHIYFLYYACAIIHTRIAYIYIYRMHRQRLNRSTHRSNVYCGLSIMFEIVRRRRHRLLYLFFQPTTTTTRKRNEK